MFGDDLNKIFVAFQPQLRHILLFPGGTLFTQPAQKRFNAAVHLLCARCKFHQVHQVGYFSLPVLQRQKPFDNPLLCNQPAPHGAETAAEPCLPVFIHPFDNPVKFGLIGIQIGQLPAAESKQHRGQRRPQKPGLRWLGDRPQDGLHFFSFNGCKNTAFGQIHTADAIIRKCLFNLSSLRLCTHENSDIARLQVLIAYLDGAPHSSVDQSGHFLCRRSEGKRPGVLRFKGFCFRPGLEKPDGKRFARFRIPLKFLQGLGAPPDVAVRNLFTIAKDVLVCAE